MTTRRKKAIRQAEVAVDTESVDVIEEVVIEEVVKSLPQLYQSTVTVRKGGPHEPKEVVGHIQFSDTTGKLTAIPSNTNYDVDLDIVVAGGLTSKVDSTVVFSPRTKAWLLNVHNGILPRGWEATEAWNRDEV
jgi:hypothetical protein|tara:strand:+ start:2645 stop:3043 length:399 start_codon:yes stop_codon:yes gene_type:complete